MEQDDVMEVRISGEKKLRKIDYYEQVNDLPFPRNRSVPVLRIGEELIRVLDDIPLIVKLRQEKSYFGKL